MEHAAHFTSLIADLVEQREKITGDPGVVVAAYDTELFGHWWYEGPAWIAAVLRNLASNKWTAVAPTAVLAERVPPHGRLLESSWGAGGGHGTWMNSETSWIWDNIHDDQRHFIELLPRLHGPTADMLLREILLEESSDWPFLITTGQARTYGTARFLEHHRKVRTLFAAVDGTGQLPAGQTGSDDPVFEYIKLDDVRRT